MNSFLKLLGIDEYKVPFGLDPLSPNVAYITVMRESGEQLHLTILCDQSWDKEDELINSLPASEVIFKKGCSLRGARFHVIVRAPNEVEEYNREALDRLQRKLSELDSNSHAEWLESVYQQIT